MVKIVGAIVLAFPLILGNAEWFLALWGIRNTLLALSLAAWFAIGAFTDMRRAFITIRPK